MLFIFHASAAFKAGYSKFWGRGENLIRGIYHFMGGIANPLETMDMFKSSIFSKNLKMAFNFNFKTCFHTFNFIIFQRIIFTQMSAFFESVFFKHCCRFLKDYSTRHCFSKMLGNWKKRVVKVKGVGALLTDLSKS